MLRQKWQALGEALKSLRMARDLGQKTVVDLSGETMGERTLRSYESGEQRPSRDRLLRLLIRSFELRTIAEINRCVQIAEYAALTESEVKRYGLETATGTPQTLQATAVPGTPADFRIEVSTLMVTDGHGREVWCHQFADRLDQGSYEGPRAVRRCVFADIDGDGRIETLFVYVSLDFASVGTTLLCFSQDGRIKWEFVPGRMIRDTIQEYFPPFFISNVQVIPVGESLGPRIVVSSNHYLHNPNQIAIVGPSGELISEYWHSGHLQTVAHADLNGDGIEEILLAGVNNGYRQATLVIFDSRFVSGASQQPGLQIFGLPPGTEKAIVLFPRTCLSKNAPYNRVSDLRITRERRIVLAVVEGVSEARNPGVMIYELDYGLRVVNARPDSHLQESHRMLEVQGSLDHAWTEDENELLRRQVVVIGGL